MLYVLKSRGIHLNRLLYSPPGLRAASDVSWPSTPPAPPSPLPASAASSTEPCQSWPPASGAPPVRQKCPSRSAPSTEPCQPWPATPGAPPSRQNCTERPAQSIEPDQFRPATPDAPPIRQNHPERPASSTEPCQSWPATPGAPPLRQDCPKRPESQETASREPPPTPPPPPGSERVAKHMSASEQTLRRMSKRIGQGNTLTLFSVLPGLLLWSGYWLYCAFFKSEQPSVGQRMPEALVEGTASSCHEMRCRSSEGNDDDTASAETEGLLSPTWKVSDDSVEAVVHELGLSKLQVAHN
eukprot:TRINITY_DN60134_c0_g1_i1.p1 TRINITY_DN60134_c0_g1~~TRINITY_DN60134_c0_g1_i1.p1  ORF type:complete len:298 (+),score=25.14 TRINITY_DN60134_c0_g1_i1:151-1044(+)